MESMTLTPMAVAAAARPRTYPSSVAAPETIANTAMTDMAKAAGRHRSCTWSSMTAGTAIRPAAKGLFEANGTRRLWEPST